jgi:hypothetical protein
LDAARELLIIVGMRISGILLVAVVLSATPSLATTRKVQPGVFVTLNASLDDAEKTWHLDAIHGRLANNAVFDNKHADINVNRLSVAVVGNDCEVTTEINFVLSTTTDQIVSVGTGTAKITLPKTQAVYKLPTLRREAIDSALVDMLAKLRKS